MDKPKPNVGFFAAILLAIALPPAYMGAYYAMLAGSKVDPNWEESVRFVPFYRWDSRVAENLFAPAHAIDRRIRHHRWGDLSLSDH